MWPMWEEHEWEDGSKGERLSTWAMLVTVVLASAFLWAGLYAVVVLIARIMGTE